MIELARESKYWSKYENLYDTYYRISARASHRRFQVAMRDANRSLGRKRPAKASKKMDVSCIRCGRAGADRGTRYCPRCSWEVVPHRWPTMSFSEIFRYGLTSLHGEDQDDPGFENAVRAIEDG